MSYGLNITRTATKQFRKLDPVIQANVAIAIISLGGKPFPSGAKRLKNGGKDCRIRVGDYRILYELDDIERTVIVWRIAHRREAYR